MKLGLVSLVGLAAARLGVREKVVVLGGDGFCGWPTSMRLARDGYDVTIVDNQSRRRIAQELGAESLTPLASTEQRVARWNAEQAGRLRSESVRSAGRGARADTAVGARVGGLKYVPMDISKDYEGLKRLLRAERPGTVVHFAVQRAAPYSMKSSDTKRYTVGNNVQGTHNVLVALAEASPTTHLVHLGTMGVYGYGDLGLQAAQYEGYANVEYTDWGIKTRILHPMKPGSVYHATKCLSEVLFQFYAKNDELAITDLHQGIVWGTHTDETRLHPDFMNRFDYDSDYGTALNRFLAQAATGHPLSVYGSGGQTRGFIHLQDTANCVALAVANRAQKGRDAVQIFNQCAESLRLRDLAEKIAKEADGSVRFYQNPRQEAPKNDLSVTNANFRALGWEPLLLDDGLLGEVRDVAQKYRHRADPRHFAPATAWNPKRQAQMNQQPVIDTITYKDGVRQ